MKSLLTILGLSLCLASPALGQDIVPHAWIMDDEHYKRDADMDGNRAGCCGESHCQPAASGELVTLPDGGVLHVPTGTSLPKNSKAIYLTADPEGKPYKCLVGGRLVCAALPGEG